MEEMLLHPSNETSDERFISQKSETEEVTPSQTTILIVEDEGIVLRFASRALMRCGYQVLTATSGEEALDVLATRADPITFVLTDVVMPGMNGLQLAEKIVRDHPSTKIMYMSAYPRDVLGNYGAVKADLNFISKPFSSGDLCAKVEVALKGAGPAA